jgi:hypothetical protein
MKNDFFALFLTNNLLKKRLTNNENLGAGKKALERWSGAGHR